MNKIVWLADIWLAFAGLKNNKSFKIHWSTHTPSFTWIVSDYVCIWRNTKRTTTKKKTNSTNEMEIAGKLRQQLDRLIWPCKRLKSHRIDGSEHADCSVRFIHIFKMSKVIPHYVINPPNNAQILAINMNSITCISSTGIQTNQKWCHAAILYECVEFFFLSFSHRWVASNLVYMHI